MIGEALPFDMQLEEMKVTCHPYRTARVFGTSFEFNRTAPAVEEMEDALAKAAGCSKDNHTCYTVINEHGKYEGGEAQPIYFWFSDSKMYVGTQLVRESW